MDKSANHSSYFNPNAANINLLWASLLIEELVRNNIKDFCIAPGSRSTPLTLAVANRDDINTHLHFDERGLGFLALGIALANKAPVVIITTSGSAVANLYPAVIEARQNKVPLIILSADRPPELIDCGANQAIDQHRIFSNYPVFFKQIPSATLTISPNYLLTIINQGINIQTHQPAPIHLNIAFPEPLYPGNTSVNYQNYLRPLSKWMNSDQPFTRYQQVQSALLAKSSTQLAGKKILLVIGRLTDKNQVCAIHQFAQEKNYPVLTDIQSSITPSANSINYYDLLLNNDTFNTRLKQADIIIQFGDKLISKSLNQFIAHFDNEYWLIEPGEQCIDPNRQLTARISCHATQWIASQAHLLPAINKHWCTTLTYYNQQAQGIVAGNDHGNELSEISMVKALDNLLRKEQPFFIGNSMPIRLCDMFMKHNQATVYSNRGASGIDGLLATAIGVAKTKQQATTLLIGDTSFLYDLNSLALLKQLEHPFVIIVINNDGGAIFNLLPVPNQQKHDFYQLPHGLTFSDICKQFAISYYHPKKIDEFVQNYQQSQKNKGALIEVCVKNDQAYIQLQQLKEQIINATF